MNTLPYSDKYRDFAVETYNRFDNDVNLALAQNKTGKSLLIVVGQEGKDSDYELKRNATIAPEDQEPAIAGAIAEISALEASARAVGAENVTLSVELNDRTLRALSKIIRENEGAVPARLADSTVFHTVAYAMERGINIVPNSPFTYKGEEATNFTIDAVRGMATESNGTPNVVVHVASMHNISNFAGYSDADVVAKRGEIDADDGRSPFNGVYDQTLMYNAARLPESMYNDFTRVSYSPGAAQTLISETNFATNPNNAEQIDAPGAFDEKPQMINVGEFVVDAVDTNLSNNRDEGLAPRGTNIAMRGF